MRHRGLLSVYGRRLAVCNSTIALLCVLLWAGCAGKRQQPGVSFYYWKTVFAPETNAQDAVTQNEADRLYIRYFDIGYDAASRQVIPVSPVQFARRPAVALVVPVIYLKNEVLRALNDTALDSLAQRTVALVRQINTAAALPMKELQIDCDWTQATATAYFRYLRAVRAALADSTLVLTATIRLHQVKYPDKTGIPPVDRGVLMYYNMGKIGNGPASSIYHRETALKYIAACNSYPLPLDFALPVFAWGIQLRRGSVVTLLNKKDERFVADDSSFVPVNRHRYKAIRAFFKDGFYFRESDEVKIEQVSGAELLEIADDLSRYYRKPVAHLIFYDLDSLNISRYDQDVFQKIARRFH